jgi:hypothetical protein
VNLARLRIRAGDGTTAWTMLETLHQAVTDRTTVTIDGIDINTADLTNTHHDHQELRQWTWTVLLGTGSHALASAGRWDKARRRLEEHHGIGQRMLDGRQIAVISHTLAGRHTQASALLRGTVPGEPWENAVTSCLDLLCARADRIETSLQYRFKPEPGQAVFSARLDSASSTRSASTDPRRPPSPPNSCRMPTATGTPPETSSPTPAAASSPPTTKPVASCKPSASAASIVDPSPPWTWPN